MNFPIPKYETGADQCRKEGCSGCSACYNNSYTATFDASVLSMKELKAELAKRIKQEQVKLQSEQINAPILQEIARIEAHFSKTIKALKRKLR